MLNKRIWTKNFILLWQGRFVSAIGDTFFEISLSFWILSVTDSGTLMGLLLACSQIPKLIVFPFAGTIIDRYDRKKIIVLMDICSGFTITGIGLMAYFHYFNIWLLILGSIILGTCSSFFRPAVTSIVPDIVPKDQLTKAISANSIIQTSTPSHKF